MFSQLPEEEKIIETLPNNIKRKRKRQAARKKKHNGPKKDIAKRKHSRFALSMSTWAENFTNAATWQLKHQIAYWKSKAKALEYENRILHEIIRKNYVNTPQDDQNDKCDTDVEENEDVDETSDLETKGDEQGDSDDVEQGNGSDIEVSEEFIQFLRNNAKYKEEAKQERERIKALNDAERNLNEDVQPGPSETAEDYDRTLKRLYGKDWQRISALEMSLQSRFLNECDSEKTLHWPNIPFNFS